MQKICLLCGNVYTKPQNCSIKNWGKRKYCSKKCVDVSKIGNPNKSETKFKKGVSSWNKGLKGYAWWMIGKPKSEKTKRKISEALIGKPTGRTGEKCNFWKGGKTEGRKKIQNSIEYKNWRRSVFERDKFTCQKCGDRNYIGRGKTIELHPHHIKEVKNYPELILELSNGITLCKDCHRATDNFGTKTKPNSAQLV